MLQSHYPERLHCLIVLDAPWLFRTLWSAISVFVDPVTSNKVLPARRPARAAKKRDLVDCARVGRLHAQIRFVTDRKSEATRAVLNQFVADDQLDQVFGGTLPQFDLQQYVDTCPLGQRQPPEAAGVAEK